MKIKGFILFILLTSIILGCKKNDDNKKDVIKVSGYVTYCNDAVAKVIVTIDSLSDLKTETDANGYFEISGITRGLHQLHISKEISTDLKSTQMDSMMFVEKTIKISVNEDTKIDNLRLPKAIKLYESNTISETRALINWSPTDDGEFREYKLYRHNSSGLDESTGTLVHVSTSISDTSFIDETLKPLQKYYYRIYVMDDFGKIGGSNIINFKTQAKELIVDGGFETVSDLNESQTNWKFDTYFDFAGWKLNRSEAFEGNQSVEITTIKEAMGTRGLYCENKNLITRSDISPGQKLQLSFQYKGSSSDIAVYLYGIFGWEYLPNITGSESEWKTFKYDYVLPENLDNLDLSFSMEVIPGYSVGKSILIDNISLKAIE